MISIAPLKNLKESRLALMKNKINKIDTLEALFGIYPFQQYPTITFE